MTLHKLPNLFSGAALAALVLVLGLSMAPPQAQAQAVNVSDGLTAQGAPLALRGYDPVAYFVAGEPRLGHAAHATVHGGATYRFASQENLAKFGKNPAAYLPQYGGFCAYGVSVGAKFDGDPNVWEIVDGKLYLNLNPEIQKIWSTQTEAAIEKADRHWKTIADAEAASLAPQG